MEIESLLDRLLALLREEERPALRQRILTALADHAGGQDEAQALRFLQDLDIFVHWRGADFMYARGIAETLRVGEDMFELAYAMKRALR